MALRGRLADKYATYADPILGVNLRASEQDLVPGEARLMSNCFFDNGVRNRHGMSLLTPTSLGGARISGGTTFYHRVGLAQQSQRLVTYADQLVRLGNTGLPTVIDGSQAPNTNVQFTTWSITEKLYQANGVTPLAEYDGTTYQPVSAVGGATNVPVATMVRPILDRLMAVTTNGVIERTNARVGHIWSNLSSWATLRPSLVGPFTAIHPHTLQSIRGDLFPGLLAFQNNAMYMITGTDFGTDVTAGSASVGEDAKIQLMDSRTGTASPYSICTVPGIGTVGVSADLNVWLLPFADRATPVFIGDKIRSTGTTLGLEAANLAALDQITMTYFDRKLILGFPTGSDTFCSRYFWLDVRSYLEHPDRGAVWNGPHTGPTVGRMWVENQNGDNALLGGESNPATGAWVYRLHQPSVDTDQIGSASPKVAVSYQTYFNAFGGQGREKYVPAVEFDTSVLGGPAAVSLFDLTGPLATGLTMTAL
jgi:hypothetical protein